MKKYFTLIIGTLLTVLCFSQNQSPNHNDIPNSTFIVTIDNVEYTLSEGEELKLDSTTVSVKLAKYRNLNNESFSFNYPNNFSYEYEEDYGYKNWTLDGNNFVIMYFEIDAETELDDFVNGMVNQFEKKNCTVEKVKKQVGNKKLSGKRINVTLVGQKLTIDFLELKMSDLKSRFIAFQDTKTEDGKSSEESKITLKMISKTIQYK